MIPIDTLKPKKISMAPHYSVISVLLLVCYFHTAISDDTTCGDWDEYNDGKCIKIFVAPGLYTYEDAKNYCEVEQKAHLIKIGFEEEQNFVESYLTSNGIADNVWIGLKFVNDSYYWADGTPLHYNKWATGSPKNRSNYCVQMQTDENQIGYWSEVACGKKNLFVCEKIRLWSATQVQTTLMNLVNNQVPRGFIYVQLPKERPPSEIWSGLRWRDVSSDYAGLFFRVVGNRAAEFGAVQGDNSPRLTHVRREKIDYNKAQNSIDITPGQESLPFDGEVSRYQDRAIYFKMSGGETRPVNMAVRVWKRVS